MARGDHILLDIGQPGNPFGELGCVRYKPEYGKARVTEFCRAAKRWRPHLQVWRETVGMVVEEAAISIRFGCGFVLDDDVGALTALADDGACHVHIHPDHFQQALMRYSNRPLVLGAWLHSIACHELAHADGRMGQGHSPAFVAARKQLSDSTADDLVPDVARLAISCFGLQILPRPWTDRGFAELFRHQRHETWSPRWTKAISSAREQIRAAREEVCADTSADCLECSSGACAIEALPSRLARAVAHLRANPPHGFSRDDIDGFLERNRGRLASLAKSVASKR